MLESCVLHVWSEPSIESRVSTRTKLHGVNVMCVCVAFIYVHVIGQWWTRYQNCIHTKSKFDVAPLSTQTIYKCVSTRTQFVFSIVTQFISFRTLTRLKREVLPFSSSLHLTSRMLKRRVRKQLLPTRIEILIFPIAIFIVKTKKSPLDRNVIQAKKGGREREKNRSTKKRQSAEVAFWRLPYPLYVHTYISDGHFYIYMNVLFLLRPHPKWGFLPLMIYQLNAGQMRQRFLDSSVGTIRKAFECDSVINGKFSRRRRSP